MTSSIQNTSSLLQTSLHCEDVFFPALQPYEEGYLQVSTEHRLWYAQYGNPHGVPVIVLHGGPAAGCGPNHMRYFDPDFYRIILLDQRGAKRSQPFASTFENTTQHLIADLEKLRKHIEVEKWLVFGGSWGSTLSLLYGQAHAENCLGFIVNGIFLGSQAEIDHLWYGMQDIYPEYWEEFASFLTPEERTDIGKSYYRRLMSEDPYFHMPAALAFIKYDVICSFFQFNLEFVQKILADEKLVLGVARMFAHYAYNRFFIGENQIIENMHKLASLPSIIVHGRYDIVCRAKNAYNLYRHWPNAQLIFVQDGGHTISEPSTIKALIEATESIKRYL